MTFYRVWHNQRNDIVLLQRRLNPNVVFEFRPQSAYEAYTDNLFPRAKAYLAHIENLTDSTIHNFQLSLAFYLVCAPFDLRPGERKDVPVIRVLLDAENYPAAVYPYHKDGANWTRSGTFSWLIEEGSYELKLLADNLYPLTTKFTLTRVRDVDWKIE
jgi:hypothetical protein